MTATALRLPAFRSGLPPIAAWEPVTTRLGFALLAVLPPLALAALLDPRELHGISLWAKPMKFAVALSLYLLTLGLFAAFVDPVWRARRRFRWPIAAGAAAIALEQVLITLQSARGVGSHFNLATGFDAGVYAAMGAGSVILTAMTLPVAAGLARYAAGRLDGGVRRAIVAGLLLTPVLTLITAGTMSSGDGHWVAGARSDAGGLALMGWARDGGDLRVPHFFATHAMHALPLAALLLLPLVRLGRRGAGVLAVLYAAFVLATFAQALAGQPFLPVLG
ncbi:hypothetical protein [Antarcticirhabdus aurantiaca]|uniref:Uncharacterized protein n=1 Tax=Antarcticirhabdus aurantiaca TaxID=2606717 RepID=A0ACD4NSR6_9HYPH|nr:hypothetical protein [Antarcticirhabdus aurantiaca]WAJ29807.1 hypothetical protein OXU80_06185 [Jeongeuplla avenae]